MNKLRQAIYEGINGYNQEEASRSISGNDNQSKYESNDSSISSRRESESSSSSQESTPKK